jgi:hypothetical protein
MSNDTLEAARAVAAAMRGEVQKKALPENVVEGELIQTEEENSNEQPGDDLGRPTPPRGEDGKWSVGGGSGDTGPAATE